MEAISDILSLLIPSYYDQAGTLGVAWYEELREEARAETAYSPDLISQGKSDWIEIELQAYYDQALREVEAEADVIAAKVVAEAEALVQKEVARGFRDTIDGNARRDPAAIGWSRHARPGACRFCRFLARDSAVYRTERGARFAAHPNCHCVARPEFEGGNHGPEADVLQYVASQRKRTEAERRQLREYLAERYPAEPTPVDIDEWMQLNT